MALWEIALELCFNQRKNKAPGCNIPVIPQQRALKTARPRRRGRGVSPGDIARRLLLCLDVGHGAVPVAERLHPHQVVPIFAALVQMAQRRHHVGQRPQIALRGVVLANR